MTILALAVDALISSRKKASVRVGRGSGSRRRYLGFLWEESSVRVGRGSGACHGYLGLLSQEVFYERDLG